MSQGNNVLHGYQNIQEKQISLEELPGKLSLSSESHVSPNSVNLDFLSKTKGSTVPLRKFSYSSSKIKHLKCHWFILKMTCPKAEDRASFK